MHFRSIVSLALASSTVLAAPFEFPLRNGFPNPSDAAIDGLEHIAGGTLSNAGAPEGVSQDGITNFKLIAFNELFETAFFTELVYNVSESIAGFELFPSEREVVLRALERVKAQEQLHTLNANGALKANGVDPIEPCQYDFPVSTFDEAIALAATFTDVVLGTLQDVQFEFANSGDVNVVPAVGSVLGQEGEQQGFYRALLHKEPSSAPFLTRGGRDFAFAAIQSFVVPGSCPNIDSIPLKTFKPLQVLTQYIRDVSSTLTFSTTGQLSGDYWIAYISGQNLPVVVPAKGWRYGDGATTFQADFPFEAGFADGLTIAALTNSAGPFDSVDAVVADTIAAPGLIEVD